MRSNLTWTSLVARQAYGIFAAGVILWALAKAFLARHPINWQSVGLLLVFLIIIIAFIWMRMQRLSGRSRAALNRNFPDTLSLETGGIKAESGNGANSFTPWAAFRSWRAGKRILILNFAEGKRFMILPCSMLSMPEKEALRGTVQSYLGPPGRR